jgi:amidophosphoribosyltransferase
MAGMMGHGDAFVLRDPAGIRPTFYYYDDEIVVVASERPVIQTAMNLPTDAVHMNCLRVQPSSSKIG